MHLQEPRHLGNRLSVLLDELARVVELVDRQGRPRAKGHASGLRRGPAGAGALHDQGVGTRSVQNPALRSNGA